MYLLWLLGSRGNAPASLRFVAGWSQVVLRVRKSASSPGARASSWGIMAFELQCEVTHRRYRRRHLVSLAQQDSLHGEADWAAVAELMLVQARSILSRLNARATDLLFPHEGIAHDMNLIDDDGEAVLIPFDETARRLIAALPTAEKLGAMARQLQPYAVNVYSKEITVPAVDSREVLQ